MERNNTPSLEVGNHDTSFLKILALILMLVDHTAIILFGNMQELRLIGRMAFPLYAWCLVVGCDKTRNIYRYGLRLLVTGLVSQPLYMMALSHPWNQLNILFTLTLGVIAIGGIRAKWYGSQIWLPVLCFVSLQYLNVDYGWRGIAFILILYGARNNRGGLISAYLAYSLFWGASSSPVSQFFNVKFTFFQWPGIGPVLGSFFRIQGMVWLSLPLIVFQTKTKIHMPKWLGYALYPLHLVLLILLRLFIAGDSWTSLISVF